MNWIFQLQQPIWQTKTSPVSTIRTRRSQTTKRKNRDKVQTSRTTDRRDHKEKAIVRTTTVLKAIKTDQTTTSTIITSDETITDLTTTDQATIVHSKSARKATDR